MENSASSPDNEISISNAVHRFVVIGPQTEDLLKESDLLGKNAEVVYSADNVNQWDIETERIEADLVVIECTTVFPETVNIIKEKTRAVGASMAIVIYHYTQQTARGMMARARLLTPLRAPITNEDLKYVCEADLAMATIRNSSLEMMEFNDEESSEEALESTKVPIRKYNDAVLNRLAKISTSIDCECPHHMAALLKSLNAFEEYCKMCESRNEEDIVLHSLLHTKTAQARSIMENALTVLADVENIDLEEG
ncbi:MAG: hypothetical protein VXW02_09970 [Verrucomicrobiota bacterium]|nr:hypothetical protein [Verrucomicrobiota bacterium]